MENYIIPLDHFEFEINEFIMEFKDYDPINFVKGNILDNSVLTSNFQSFFGWFDTERIKQGNYLILSFFSQSKFISDKEKKVATVNVKNILHLTYGISQGFSLCLWLIKDNSVNTAFSLWADDERPGGFKVIKDVMTSNSKGKYYSVMFTHSEVIQAIEWMNILSGYFIEEQEDLREYEGYTSLNSEIEHNTGSFKRALTYLEQARASSFVPAKIASYISILETLFVVEDSNTYKTPERTAIFLGGNLEQRKINFQRVKDAYDVRSSYVHGSNVYKKHHKRLDDISFDLDGIIREVLIQFFRNFSDLEYNDDKEKNKVNQYFIDLVLGGD